MTATTFTRAHRGDLAVMQTIHGGPVYVGVVATVNREGVMRRVDWAYDPEAAEAARRMPLRTLLAPRGRVTDTAAALDAARRLGPCDSIDEMALALRPYLIGA